MARHEASTRPGGERWVLLIHQIPPRPAYLRVKVGRHLQRIGAVAIKNSVYALPRDDETLEDFQWVLREIVKGGGDGSIVDARFVEGLSDKQVVALFQSAREADYREIAGAAREVAAFVPRKGPPPDMFDAEFTHDGDLCTFEVLLDRFGLDEPALRTIAEIVHDVDVKDAKFGREEAAGVGQVVAGIAAAHPDDEARLERGSALFEDLYALHRGAARR